MSRNQSLFLFLCIVFLISTSYTIAQSNISSNQPINYLRKPTEVRGLPKNIVEYLEKTNCLIPKSVNSDQSIGGFRGSFSRKEQTDWVTLCSRNGVSSILIFWKGSIASVSEIAKKRDADFIRRNSTGELEYFRRIGLDGVNDMIDYNKELFEENPIIDHVGIDETTADGLKIVYYLHNDRWLILKRPIQ